LGDVDEDGNKSDLSISNNNDLEKVFSTVIHSLEDFFEIHPTSKVYFTGSSYSRTRLYRITI
jgi:hypothetical protein